MLWILLISTKKKDVIFFGFRDIVCRISGIIDRGLYCLFRRIDKLVFCLFRLIGLAWNRCVVGSEQIEMNMLIHLGHEGHLFTVRTATSHLHWPGDLYHW